MNYRRPHDAPDQIDAIARATALAFGSPTLGVREWLAMAGHQHIRALLDDDGAPRASLLALPMGQFFGGRSVPMQGIAGVAVPPEARGQGLGLALMREQIREAARDGIPLSCLYASTQALYRQVGYEQAGLLFRTNIPLRTIGARERSLPVRQLTEDDHDAVAHCYRASAARTNGMLDRGPYIWFRVRKLRDEPFTGFGVFAPDQPRRLEGYVFMAQRRKPESGRHDLAVSDLAFTTPRAARRLLGLLADFATVGDDALLDGPPLHPICTLMSQQYHTSRFVDVWMLRINLLRPALEIRGYPPALDTALALEVTDDLVPQNAGRHTLHVRGGSATLKQDGVAPTLRADIRALAAIYSGLHTATQAAALGLVDAEPQALDVADAIFAGPTPSMVDRF